MRSTRAVAALIKSLMLGSTTTAFVVVSALSTVSCKDESQPEYWVEKLDDSAWRARAVNRLAEMFEGVISRSNKDLKAEPVQQFIGKTLDPLMKLYIEQYDVLDSKTRVSTIKLLADFRDKRTEPALKRRSRRSPRLRRAAETRPTSSGRLKLRKPSSSTPFPCLCSRPSRSFAQAPCSEAFRTAT
jgi:hypothetical protein